MERNDEKTIAVFGGSRVADDGPLYQEALQLGRLLAESGFTVMTGGYQGTMEATSRGAKEAGGRTIGVKSAVFDPLPTNAWLDEEVSTPDLFSRLDILISRADAYVILKGSMGTLAELALAWNMARIKPVPPRPIILIGQGWRRVVGVLIQELNVSQHELSWLQIVETPEKAVATLHQQFLEG